MDFKDYLIEKNKETEKNNSLSGIQKAFGLTGINNNENDQHTNFIHSSKRNRVSKIISTQSRNYNKPLGVIERISLHDEL